MREETILLDPNGGKLVDVDYRHSWLYLGITDQNVVVTPSEAFKINREFKYPLIRAVDEQVFLVAECRVDKRVDNCLLFDFQGKQLTSFFAGDGIQDIEVVNNRIVISYFDEGVYGMDGPNNEGLAVFDLNGEMLLGYNSKHREYTIDDCYCMCANGAHSILFFPYMDFPLIELNLNTGEEKTYKTPAAVRGSAAITSFEGKIIFHSPYDEPNQFLLWSIGQNQATHIGEYPGMLRGLRAGQFLSKGEKGFTLINFG